MSSSLNAQISCAVSHLAPERMPLRVLLVTEASAKGNGRHVVDLAEGLLARGCDVHLLYSPTRMDETFRARINSMPGLTHVALPMHRSIHPSDFSAVWATRRYLRRFGPFDVIHGHSSKGGALARLAAIGTGVPAIYTPNALVMMDPDLPAIQRFIFGLIERALFWFTARVVVVAPEEERFAIGMGLDSSRLVLIPNGVGPLELTPRDSTRRELGLADDDLVIGWVGRLIDCKVPDMAVAALAIALKDAPQLRLVVVGDGPMGKQLTETTEKLGISKRVLRLGDVDARKVFSAFDLYTITSRKEGLPYVVLEAMTCGLPVVATSTAGVELLVKSGVNGTLVGPNDCNGLAAAFVALARNRELLARQGNASRRMVADFSVEHMVDRNLAVYRSCVRGPARETVMELAGEGA